jgi:hypothetical protein
VESEDTKMDFYDLPVGYQDMTIKQRILITVIEDGVKMRKSMSTPMNLLRSNTSMAALI